MQQSLYTNFVPATLLDLLFLIMNEVFFSDIFRTVCI